MADIPQPNTTPKENEQVLKAFSSLLGAKALTSQQEKRVSGISGILGPVSGTASQKSNAAELVKLLVTDTSSPVGGGICCIPSFDLYSGEVPVIPLPQLGSSHSSSSNNKNNKYEEKDPSPSESVSDVQSVEKKADLSESVSDGTSSSEDKKISSNQQEDSVNPEKVTNTKEVNIPTMAASVFSSSGNHSNTSQSPKNPPESQVSNNETSSSDAGENRDEKEKGPEQSASTANANATLLEQAAARNLSSKITWTKSSIHLAPMALLQALSGSFSSLVESRVRAWTLLLLRHSLSNGDDASRNHLMSLLATSSTLSVTDVVTTFQTLKMPPSSAEKAEEKTKDEIEKPMVLPLLFEATIGLKVQGKQLSCKIRAPGTIKATFKDSLISTANIDLNTNTLVSSMVDQARLVVFQAVARATNVLSPNSSSKKQAGNPAFRQQFSSVLNLSRNNMENSSSLSRKNKLPSSNFSNILPTPKNSRKVPLQKDRSSSMLPPKARSVTWNHGVIEYSDSNKRQKVTGSVQTLKSSKSFGKPDAGLFESQRNATFAEFGRSHANPNVPTFVNGRLQVNNGGNRANNLSNLRSSTTMNFDGSQDGLGRSFNRNSSFSAATLSLFNGNKRRSSSSNFFNLSPSTNDGAKSSKASLFGDLRRSTGSSASLLGELQRNSNSSLSRSGSTKGLSGLTGIGSSVSLLQRTPTALESLLLAASAKKNVNGLSRK
eukprot:CAMPEP_0178980364 /NCGR_PEP_ID=MMETSP0789-20121207/26450_1 /TAXON_ID=3005 /ORGANISM="Rhizosolenia setigera, Strain CCMP 1694" /LENGTH=717 /DNA_ID=CAMNT_0020670759 /DNA_START=49 /DNA_END=2203 /DNA_ORIENTATION=+